MLTANHRIQKKNGENRTDTHIRTCTYKHIHPYTLMRLSIYMLASNQNVISKPMILFLYKLKLRTFRQINFFKMINLLISIQWNCQIFPDCLSNASWSWHFANLKYKDFALTKYLKTKKSFLKRKKKKRNVH